MPNMKLQSSEGEIFEVDIETAMHSVLIKTMLKNLGITYKVEEIVSVPCVDSAILREVIQWLTYQKDDPPPPKAYENREIRCNCSSIWDDYFLRIERRTYCELITAHYLGIKELEDVMCKTMNNKKGKSPPEIREAFESMDDFTGSEGQQVHKENEACEEE